MSAAVASLVSKLMAPLQRRVRLMVARAIVELVDDSRKMQTVQVSLQADTLRDEVEHFQPFGFSSVPAAGAEAIVLTVGGTSDHPVTIVVDDRRYRPTSLAEGESCLYTLANGVRVLCKADGTVEIGTEPSEFAARADRVDAELEALKDKFNGHTHQAITSVTPAAGPGVSGGVGSTGASSGPSTGSYSPSSTAADEVKIK